MAYVTLGSKAVGSVVKIKVNGIAWEWLVVHQGLPGGMYDASCNGTWLLLKNIFEMRQWDSSNVNDYANSTINKYLNNTWYNLIDTTIRNQIKQVKIPYRPGSGTNKIISNGANGLSCKVFFLSGIETNSTYGYVTMDDGTKLSYFNTDNSQMNKERRIAYLTGTATNWWIRSPYTIDAKQAGYVTTSGNHAGWGGGTPNGTRPAVILPTTIYVDDAGNLTTNTAPTVPGSITVPTAIKGGATAAISWAASTDAESNLSGYVLERQSNGGAWAQLYKGGNRSYTDNITKGWNTVAYRVKAYDAGGLESAYRTSATLTVNNNTAPVISGSDGSLGNKTGAFSQTYTVSDVDAGQTLTVTEKLDGATRRTYTATSGATNTLAVTAADWIKVLNGTHTIVITASDGNGGTFTRTWTFSKSVTEVEFGLAAPLPADAMPTKGIASLSGEIPAGAVVLFEVCNNAYDVTPTWEDVTSQVLGRSKFFFFNTTKTAPNWGVRIRVRVDRSGVSGPCYIQSLGGYFE